MFDHLFENRNKTVTSLLKLSDCLGRSLRENVELFAIDSERIEAAFLTESGQVIVGNYSLTDSIVLENIRIQSMDIFSDNDVFDSLVNEKITDFLGSINFDDYSSAEGSFSKVLSLWENRLKFNTTKKRLEEKVLCFSESQNIVDTEECQRFLEILPQFSEFLSQSKEDIMKFKEIENSIKLSNSVAKAFNFPKLEISELDNSSYKISKGINESIYELICRQELVKKELLESKKSFDNIWATNSSIRKLSSLLFESSDDVILEALVDAVVEIPFLALTTKKQLNECFENSLGLLEHNGWTEGDVKEFSSKIFEFKKPIKKTVISLLNEKYGINVQNLKETATFQSLANTQIVIFETLARLAPKNSVVKASLLEMAGLLKNKNGVEVIDINDILQTCFTHCGYSEFINEPSLVEGVSFETILEDNETASTILEKAKNLLLDKKKKKEDTDDKGEDSGDEFKKKEMESSEKEGKEESEGDDEDDSMKLSDKKSNKRKSKDIDKDGKEDKEVDEATEMDSEEADTTKNKPLTQDEFLDALKDLDSLVDTLSDDETDNEE